MRAPEDGAGFVKVEDEGASADSRVCTPGVSYRLYTGRASAAFGKWGKEKRSPETRPR